MKYADWETRQGVGKGTTTDQEAAKELIQIN